MGLIRGGLLAVISVLLFFSILAGDLLLTISLSLTHDNVQTHLSPLLRGEVDEHVGANDILNERYPAMVLYCQSYTDYVVQYEGYTMVIPCSVVSQGEEAVLDYGINDLVSKVYYSPYDCKFWDCFKEQSLPLFLVSAKAQQYWYAKFNYALIIIGVLSILGFLMAEKKSNFFILLSVLLIIAALPFAKFDLILKLAGSTFSGLLQVFFSQAYSVFIKTAIIGAALLGVGLILKLFRVGFKISTIFAKAKEKREEEKKEKETEKEIKKLKEEVKKVKEKTENKKPAVKKVVKKSRKK
jgi:hypothetical protein